ncbi:MAG TPA: type II secretion system F family protein [Tepidisphaeraceae bacterium]|jgi:tight adherence protein C
MNDQIIMLLCIAGAVALVAFVGGQVILNRGDEGKLRTRLKGGGLDALRASSSSSPHSRTRFKDLVQHLGQKAAKPFMSDDANKQVAIRGSLARAGIYNPSAIRVVAGAKVILSITGIVVGYAVGVYLDHLMMGLSVGGLAGYLAPVIWLKIKTSVNQRELTHGLADALDLMVVCIEAGLTIDGAMQRVGQELSLAHPEVSREFGMAHMETRVGLSRTESLKNMGTRTGNTAIQSLASMLVQADRFGTSIADALRVHSDTLRVNRQMAAEEAAGKASVKMSFPLVLCIFPATFIVLAGPTVIQLMQSDLFK